MKSSKMYKRQFRPSLRSFFLLGPRGTGKTTYLLKHYKSAVFYDLLDYATYLRLLRDPSLFKKELLAIKNRKVIVVDEVQKLPRLLDDVQYFLSDINNKKQFILSGSSARKLRRSSVNLLAGRASQKFFYPLVHSEYPADLPVEAVLKYGTLPEVLNLKKEADKVEFLTAYVRTYLREEIQQEAVAKNMESFSRFLDTASLCNGQVTNLSSLSRDTGVARATLKNYFQILEDTLVGTWLRALRPRARIKETQAPKFFLFDTGVARALANQTGKDLNPMEKGFLLETYILHELKFWNQHHNWAGDIHFWKTHNGAEMDFILQIEGRKVGLEIKASATWKKEFGRHLNKALKENTVQRALGVYLGEQKLKHHAIEVYPLSDFLKILQKNQVLL